MTGLLRNWPRLVFIFVPLSIAVVSGTVLVMERLQPETEKAIRLVKESTSRKENFTVQQYLYSTVYYRKEKGEPISIEGWKAKPLAGPDSPLSVEFGYTDQSGSHTAAWRVDLEQKQIASQNDAARELSWH